jgi:AbrB family transcriptional regulator, transcriptional pleiotropic regulator of transition state genes
MTGIMNLESLSNNDVFCEKKKNNIEICKNMGRKIIMKSTGIVRKVDELGRVVIPIELRRTLGIAEKDALEIYVDDERIILKKYQPSMTCQITGEVSDGNITIGNGKIILSREGAELVLKELQEGLQVAK